MIVMLCSYCNEKINDIEWEANHEYYHPKCYLVVSQKIDRDLKQIAQFNEQNKGKVKK